MVETRVNIVCYSENISNKMKPILQSSAQYYTDKGNGRDCLMEYYHIPDPNVNV